jgi:hypothetical protein
MQTKTSTLLAISIAAILTLSVVAIGEIPQAAADKDHKKKNGFSKEFKELSKKPDFESKNCIATSYATTYLSPDALAALDCNIQAWLDNKGESMVYKISISGMELIDSDADTQDDLYQLHIHKNTLGTPENPMGPHVLDVYRAPTFGDADLVVLPVQGELRGIWDDGDHDPLTDENNLERLCNSEIFAAGHGDEEDVPGHHAPYIKMLLEPTKEGDKVCKKLGF